MAQRRTMLSIAICLVALAALRALDLWTKDWAQDRLSVAPTVDPGPACAPDKNGRFQSQRRGSDFIELVPNYLALRYAENCGAAFGVMRSAPSWVRTGIFTVAALGFMGLLFSMYLRGGGGRMFTIAVPLIASGALGNLVDRIRYGYVIDFIRYHGLFEWPTFNVADIAIAVGAAFLFLDGFGGGLRARSAEPRAETTVT